MIKGQHEAAVTYVQMGLIWQAKKALENLLTTKPHHPESLQLMSLIYHQEGDDVKAIQILENAITSKKQDASFLKESADRLANWGFPDKAAEIYEEILRTSSDKPSENSLLFAANIKLGEIYNNLANFNEAIRCSRNAIHLDHSSADAHNNLGVSLYEQGNLNEAANCFQKAVSINPSFINAYYNLGNIRREQGQRKEAATFYKKTIAVNPVHPEALTQLAIFSWINGEWQKCSDYLAMIPDIHQFATTTDKHRFFVPFSPFVVPYFTYLNSLLAYRKKHPDLFTPRSSFPPLYICGDSNCLSPAHTTVSFAGNNYHVKPKLVMGCKAWHLGNNQLDSYKREFESTVKSLPHGANVVAMFGEIDCRSEEGIINHFKKSGENMEKSIQKLIINYLDYILARFKLRGISPIIFGVPTQLLEDKSIPAEDIALLGAIVEIFNRNLSTQAKIMGLQFADIYQSLLNGGYQHDIIHLDDNNHVKPTIFGETIKKLA